VLLSAAGDLLHQVPAVLPALGLRWLTQLEGLLAHSAPLLATHLFRFVPQSRLTFCEELKATSPIPLPEKKGGEAGPLIDYEVRPDTGDWELWERRIPPIEVCTLLPGALFLKIGFAAGTEFDHSL
jgi:hypothetical protein